MTRLDLALIRLHTDLSRRKARDVIEKGQVLVEGELALLPGTPVQDGARIEWNPNQKARRRARSSIPLLYQDASLVIVDKPAGLLSVPTPSGDEGEDTALARVQAFAHHLRPGNPYVGVVHRIDRGTSGTLVFALTPPARDALRALFRDHRMERRYTALVLGTPSGDVGLVDRPIHDSYQGGRRRIARAGEPSHPALTRYRVLERLPHAAFLEVELETGRQHQIRLHLASIGLPIVGDLVYGGGPGPGRPMLHARTLRFVHPITGHTVTAESPLPADFSATLLSLRRGQTVAGTSSRGPRRPRAARVEEPRRGPRPGRKAPRGGTR